MFVRNRKKKRLLAGGNNNRINLLVAIIFLLGGGVILKMFDLQVLEHDLYVAKASNQHDFSSVLAPERGRIFVQDDSQGSSDNLYPIATNKKFALVYVIPKDIAAPDEFAEKFYAVFNQAGVEKEVNAIFNKEENDLLSQMLSDVDKNNPRADGEEVKANEQDIADKKVEAQKSWQAIISAKAYLDTKSKKREEEIKKRKDVLVKKYLDTFTKNKEDVYEPIEPKVDDDTLKQLYAGLAVSTSTVVTVDKDKKNLNTVSLDALEIKDDGMYLKDGDASKKMQIPGVAYSSRSLRFYPENNIGAQIIGYVGINKDDKGKYGLEGFYDKELTGTAGLVKAERGASRALVIASGREYVGAQNGSNLVLTINRTVQFTVCQKLNEAVRQHKADGGTIIIIEPKTGAIIAMCSNPDYDPNKYKEVDDISVYNNPAIFVQYEPGSVFKPLTMSAAINEGKVTPDTTYTDKGFLMIDGWPKPIRNSDYETHGGHGVVDMNTVLEFSLNTGAIFAMQQATPKVFAEYVRNFGFGEKTGFEMEGEATGDIRHLTGKNITKINAATAAFGQGISVSPLQMAMSYGVIANGGILMKPYIVKAITNDDGTVTKTKSREIRRVISERTAALISGMLVRIVEQGHATKAQIPGYYIGGKTGTAQVAAVGVRGYSNHTIHTFAAIAPANDPRFVTLVKMDSPKDARFAESSVVPLYRDIAEFLLNYYKIPKDRTVVEKKK